ncbi:CinA family protein [Gordonia spumicola]|uniref:CinA family protein n=1 Tax=Gordonia spumicola TaxID=589161 RepID=UPI003530B841
MVAARLTDRAGSSAYLLGVVVSYSNEVKTGVLGVPAELIAELGAVSEPVCRGDGRGRPSGDGRRHLRVSTTGIAGPTAPGPQTRRHRVLRRQRVAGRETVTVTRLFPGDRDSVRRLATTAAFHLLAAAL